jgi:hypothetical protein
VQWHKNTFFVIGGQTLYWQEDYFQTRVYRMNTDGTAKQSFYVAGCPQRWGGAQVFGGDIYFWYGNDMLRVPLSVIASTPCQPVFTASPDVQSVGWFFLDSIENALWLQKEEKDVGALVRIGLSPISQSIASSPNAINVTAADDTALYGHDNPNFGSASYRILRFDRAGKATSVLAEWVVVPHVLLAADGFVFYESNGTIYRIPRDADAGARVAVQPLGQPYRYVRDGSDIVYWKYGDPHLYRAPIAGGPTTTIFVGQQIWGLVFNDTHYYAMTTDGADIPPFGLLSIAK